MNNKYIILIIILIYNINAYAQDSVIVYYLYPLSTSIVSIKCENVKKMAAVKCKVIFLKKEVEKAKQVLLDMSNYSEDSSDVNIDSRISFEFIINNNLNTLNANMCWIKGNRMEINGKIYTYNQKVEDYLFLNGFIFKIK